MNKPAYNFQINHRTTFKENLVRARSHIVFIAGILTALALISFFEDMPYSYGKYSLKKTTQLLELPPQRELTAQEMQWARTAWRYFENNTIEQTGMVNSVDGYTASTMWDTSSYLMGLISAYKLGIVDTAEFNSRIRKVLISMTNMPLYEGKLPNKSYNTISMQMVDYKNQPTEKGIGWSALDIGRVLVPLNILIWQYPQHNQAVKKLIRAWDFKALIKDGTMYGALYENGETLMLQEGRLGYEEYVSKSFNLMGLDVSEAIKYNDYMKLVNIMGINVATDNRSPDIFKALNYVDSEPYILDGVEFGWDHNSYELSYRVFKVQEQRYIKTGILTAVSKDNLDREPYFIYNTVFTSGKAWNTITEEGVSMPHLKTLSTKAVIGWHMVYENEYTSKLIQKLPFLFDPKKGWYSGMYEQTGEVNKAITCNSNGIILEALAYKKFGVLTKI